MVGRVGKEGEKNTLIILPLALKPTTRAHDGNTLIHDNLANGKIPRDPRLCGFIVGDFVFVDTGAGL